MKGEQVLFSSGCAEWRTPPALFEKLNSEFTFECDAAARHHNKLAPCLHDAFQELWYSPAYCNPEYGVHLEQWMAHIWHNAKRGCEVVALLPVRSDCRWWHEYVMNADELRLIKGRVKFWLTDDELRIINAGREQEGKPPMRQFNSAPFPSCVVVWRPFPQQRGGPPRLMTWSYPK